jgi:hypothetical protein
MYVRVRVEYTEGSVTQAPSHHSPILFHTVF